MGPHLGNRHGIVWRLVMLAVVGHVQTAFVLAHVLGAPAQVADCTMHRRKVPLGLVALG